jgi:hypothetical protein
MLNFPAELQTLRRLVRIPTLVHTHTLEVEGTEIRVARGHASTSHQVIQRFIEARAHRPIRRDVDDHIVVHALGKVQYLQPPRVDPGRRNEASQRPEKPIRRKGSLWYYLQPHQGRGLASLEDRVPVVLRRSVMGFFRQIGPHARTTHAAQAPVALQVRHPLVHLKRLPNGQPRRNSPRGPHQLFACTKIQHSH